MSFAAYRLGGTDPWQNLALEEAFLRSASIPAPLLLFYVNEPCLVVGRNQNPWAEVAADSGLPVLRRVSGGGTVYHDRGNLNWSLIVPRSGHDSGRELGAVSSALGSLGVAALPGERGGLFVADGPFAGRKLSGTARRLEAARVLHHGTLLVASDLDRLTRSLGGMRLSWSRALASVPALPVNLTELLPGIGIDEVVVAFAASICGRAVVDASLEEVQSALGLGGSAGEARSRLKSWQWTWGASPPFSVRVCINGKEITLSVRDGIVSGVEGEGSGDCAFLIGKAFDRFLLAAPGSQED